MPEPSAIDSEQEFLTSRPSGDGLDRLSASLGGLRIQVVRRLPGGLDCSTHLLRQGDRRLVLKRFRPDHSGAIVEFENLGFAAAAAVATPEPLAADEAGEWFGTPALVMSALPGRAMLNPSEPRRWVKELAVALAAVHEVDPTGLPPRPAPLWQRWQPWIDPPDRRMTAIAAAVAELGRHAQTEPAVLSHCDYHPGNVLFSRGRLSGITDWRGARPEPRQHDVAYCRKDLALNPGGDLPDQFLAAYEAEVGFSLPLVPLWDVLCGSRGMQYGHRWVTSFAEMGVPLGPSEIVTRSTTFVDAALMRLSRI